MNLRRDLDHLLLRDGAHLAHADAERRLAGALDLALLRRLRRRHRLAHPRDRRRVLRRLHRAGPDHADAPHPEHVERLLRHLLPEVHRARSTSSCRRRSPTSRSSSATSARRRPSRSSSASSSSPPRRSSSTSGSSTRSAMVLFLVLTCADLLAARLHHRHLGQGLRAAPGRPAPDHHAARLPRRHLLLDHHAAAVLADARRCSTRSSTWSAASAGASTASPTSTSGSASARRSSSSRSASAIVAWIFRTGYRLKN